MCSEESRGHWKVWPPVVRRALIWRQTAPPEQVAFGLVADGYFELLRIRPILGRLFDADLLPDGTMPALISYPYWQGRWGGGPEVIGQTMQLEDQPVMTIIGVLPETFRTPFTAALPNPVWVPVGAVRVPEGFGFSYSVHGRLRPGETLESAETELAVLQASLVEGASDNEQTLALRPLSERVVGTEARRTVLIFGAAVGMVLLIGVLNLVNLQASRISERRGEFAIRAAIGASRSRLIRQTIAESVLLRNSANDAQGNCPGRRGGWDRNLPDHWH